MVLLMCSERRRQGEEKLNLVAISSQCDTVRERRKEKKEREKRGKVATGGCGQRETRECGRVLPYYAAGVLRERLAVVVLGSNKVRSAREEWRGLSQRRVKGPISCARKQVSVCQKWRTGCSGMRQAED